MLPPDLVWLRDLLLPCFATELTLEPVPGFADNAANTWQLTGQDHANDDTDKNPDNEHGLLLGRRSNATSVVVVVPHAEVAMIDLAVEPSCRP
jgi:hypothetical protein